MSNSSIWLIDRTLSGATTPGQSGPGSNDNEGVLCIPLKLQHYWSLTFRLFSVQSGHSFGWGLTPLKRYSRRILQPHPSGLFTSMSWYEKVWEWLILLYQRIFLNLKVDQTKQISLLIMTLKMSASLDTSSNNSGFIYAPVVPHKTLHKNKSFIFWRCCKNNTIQALSPYPIFFSDKEYLMNFYFLFFFIGEIAEDVCLPLDYEHIKHVWLWTHKTRLIMNT